MKELLLSSPLPSQSYAWSEAREILKVNNPAYKYYKNLQVYRYQGVGAVYFDLQSLPLKHQNKKSLIKSRCKSLSGFMPTLIASKLLSIPTKAFHDKGVAYRELRELFEVVYIGRYAYVNISKFRSIYKLKNRVVSIVNIKDIESYKLEGIEIFRISKNYFLVSY